MSACRVLRKSVRSLYKEGNEYVLSYALSVRESPNGTECYIEASVKTKDTLGATSENSCCVAISDIPPSLAGKVFELISGAKDPVFPVHVPDVVADQISAANRMSVKLREESEPISESAAESWLSAATGRKAL